MQKVDYLNNPWKPARYSIFKNEELESEVYDNGFAFLKPLSKEGVEKLKNLYYELHQLNTDKGGMFYSVYSQNISYRRKVNDSVIQILEEYLKEYFTEYRPLLGSFVIKVAGPESEFYLHQDTTGLDERVHSPINLWIPLQDVDETNGCMGMLPKSQHFFSPYRSISFPAPFDSIQSTVKQYLQPFKMKEGEVLAFDNRMLHNSYANNSGQTRIAVVCGLFPKDAPMITCFKNKYELGGEVELIQHEDSFLIENPNFLIDCQARPQSGKTIEVIEDPYYGISEEDFASLCKEAGLEKGRSNSKVEQTNCNLIGEPVLENQANVGQETNSDLSPPQKKRSFFQRLFG